MTQAKFAQHLGISQGFFNQILRKTRDARYGLAKKIAKKIGTDVLLWMEPGDRMDRQKAWELYKNCKGGREHGKV